MGNREHLGYRIIRQEANRLAVGIVLVEAKEEQKGGGVLGTAEALGAEFLELIQVSVEGAFEGGFVSHEFSIGVDGV